MRMCFEVCQECLIRQMGLGHWKCDSENGVYWFSTVKLCLHFIAIRVWDKPQIRSKQELVTGDFQAFRDGYKIGTGRESCWKSPMVAEKVSLMTKSTDWWVGCRQIIAYNQGMCTNTATAMSPHWRQVYVYSFAHIDVWLSSGKNGLSKKDEHGGCVCM